MAALGSQGGYIRQQTKSFLGGNGEQKCSLASKINFPIPGLGVFHSMACSGSEMNDVFSSIVLPTTALSSKRRESCIEKGLEFHNHAVGV